LSDSVSKFENMLEWIYPERWVSTPAGFVIAVAAGTGYYGLASLLPIKCPWLGEWDKLTVAALTALITLMTWFTVRNAYWRWGGNARVGICYDGIAAPMSDWVRTRQLLQDSVIGLGLGRRVCIRMLPARVAVSDVYRKKLQARYDFPLILIASISRSEDGTEVVQTDWKSDFHGDKAEEMRLDLNRFSKDHLNTIPGGVSKKDIFAHRARCLFDSLLYSLGVVSIAELRHTDGSAYLGALEKRLDQGQSDQKTPLPLVRLLWVRCQVVTSQYRNASPPGTDELEIAAQRMAEAIERVGHQFPGLYRVQTRNMFFLGRIAEARKLAESLLATPNLSAVDAAEGRLNLGVLLLFEGNWIRAAELLLDFTRRLKDPKNYYQTVPLLEFADIAADLGYQGSIFLQAYYRKLFAVELHRKDIFDEAEAWLKADRSRQALWDLYIGNRAAFVFEARALTNPAGPAPTQIQSRPSSKTRSKRKRGKKGG
jgi:hypothetical protein